MSKKDIIIHTGTVITAIIVVILAVYIAQYSVTNIFNSEKENNIIDVKLETNYSHEIIDTELEEYYKERTVRQETFDSTTSSALRKATSRDYSLWLNGYLSIGNSATHTYDYPMSEHDNWFVATKNFSISPMYGSMSVNIIVPENIELLEGDLGYPNLGHSRLYFMKDFKVSGMLFVPIYSDTFY